MTPPSKSAAAARAGASARRTPPGAGSVLSRAEVEAREDASLAPYAQRASRSRGRAHPEPEHALRTAYMRDRDRVVHAEAFRRLEYKTQVFVNQEGDGYRTRLTHTMEVAQVARTVARALRLNEDLTEAIALSHDVGHGPFGHAGEAALDACMREHGGFEHNAHGLRVVDVLERRYAAFRGLNLTFEVREAFAMHSPRDKASMGFERRRPLLEAQVVDLCDGLTYTAHDLDDGIAAGCVTVEELRENDLWRETWDAAGDGGLPDALRVPATVRRVIDASVADVLQATAKRIEAAGVASPGAVQSHPHLLAGFSEAFGRRQRGLSRLLHERFYRHPRLVRAAARAKRFLTAVFEAYVGAPEMLDRPRAAWAAEVGVPRAVCDVIAGMTDREAQEEYRRLFLPFGRD